MSHNPLDNITRHKATERRTFPNALYEDQTLAPARANVDALLVAHAISAHKARIVDLCELRSISGEDAAVSLQALDADPSESVPGTLPLANVERMLTEVAGGQGLMASAPEEILATASRLALRESLLGFLDGLLHLRGEVARLALSHLTTAVTLTSNGQMVQPTTLGHYLTGTLGPLQRASTRLVECWTRLNVSSLGAVSGVATAIPIRRNRQAELLAFDGPVDHTFDALAAADVEYELVSICAGVALEVGRLVSDLAEWARDDAGTIVPSEEFVHGGGVQPQRRDPLVLEHLAQQFLGIASIAGQVTTRLTQRSMIAGSVTRAETTLLTTKALTEATNGVHLLTGVLKSLEVNRALTANRTHRGFATSSELADLLAIDCGLTRNEAYALAERVATEASILTLGGMTLDTKLVDKLALEVVGREVGIEPETLGKCLSVKRFIERREVPGGPAPPAVRAMIEYEHLLRRADQAWLEERWKQIEDGENRLAISVAAIIGEKSTDNSDDKL